MLSRQVLNLAEDLFIQFLGANSYYANFTVAPADMIGRIENLDAPSRLSFGII